MTTARTGVGRIGARRWVGLLLCTATAASGFGPLVAGAQSPSPGLGVTIGVSQLGAATPLRFQVSSLGPPQVVPEDGEFGLQMLVRITNLANSLKETGGNVDVPLLFGLFDIPEGAFLAAGGSRRWCGMSITVTAGDCTPFWDRFSNDHETDPGPHPTTLGPGESTDVHIAMRYARDLGDPGNAIHFTAREPIDDALRRHEIHTFIVDPRRTADGEFEPCEAGKTEPFMGKACEVPPNLELVPPGEAPAAGPIDTAEAACVVGSLESESDHSFSFAGLSVSGSTSAEESALADGTIEVKQYEGHGFGLDLGYGAKVQVGSLSLGEAFDATARLVYGNGSTLSFDSPTDADTVTALMAGRLPPGERQAAGELAAGHLTSSYYNSGVDLSAELDVEAGSKVDLGVSAHLGLSFGVTEDRFGNRTTSSLLRLAAGLGVEAGPLALGGGQAAGHDQVDLTVDKDDKPTALEVTIVVDVTQTTLPAAGPTDILLRTALLGLGPPGGGRALEVKIRWDLLDPAAAKAVSSLLDAISSNQGALVDVQALARATGSAVTTLRLTQSTEVGIEASTFFGTGLRFGFSYGAKTIRRTLLQQLVSKPGAMTVLDPRCRPKL